MNKEAVLHSLSHEIVAKFRQAIELGKWENGDKLTAEQTKICLQAVMIWEHEHLPPSERTGYIHKAKDDKGTPMGEACVVEHHQHYPHAIASSETLLKIKH